MKVSQIKPGEPMPTLTIDADLRVREGLAMMAKNQVHHLVVLEGRTLKGVVDDRVLLSALADKDPSSSEPKISDIKLINVPIADPAMEIGDALDLLKEKGVGVLLIQGEADSFGIVTEKDFLNFLHGLLSEESAIHPVLRTELQLANPLFQGIMRTLSDIGL